VANEKESVPEKKENGSIEDQQVTEESDEVVLQQALKSVPPEDRLIINQAISILARLPSQDSQQPLHKRLNDGHIEKLIDNLEAESQRQDGERRSRRMYQLVYFLSGLVFVGALIGLFTYLNRPSELTTIITALLAFGSGFAVAGRTKK